MNITKKSTMYSSDNDSSKSSETKGSLTGLILWSIVLANTDSEVYDLLDKQWYYKLAINNTIGFAAILGGLLITLCSLAWGFEKCASIMGGITTFAAFGIIITNLVYIGLIMDADIEHTFIGYKAFWRNGAMNFTRLEDPNIIMPSSHPIINSTTVPNYTDTPHWPYIFSDILVRVCSGALMVVLFIAAFGLVVITGSAIQSKCKR